MELSEQPRENADKPEAIWPIFQNWEKILGKRFDQVRGHLKTFIHDIEVSKEQFKQ
jgi:hypothetical protein